jgi:hypothetical protein
MPQWIFCREITVSTAILLPPCPVDNAPLAVSPGTGMTRQNIVVSKARQLL